MAGHDVRSVYMTFPDQESAATVAQVLLAEGLIACANIFPAGRSLYRWQGATHDEPETVAVAKSSAALLDRLVARVNELHPYDTPCVVALAAVGGDPEYLAWVEEQASPGSAGRPD
jgi:periplasmic divalent cation tolerance protein